MCVYVIVCVYVCVSCVCVCLCVCMREREKQRKRDHMCADAAGTVTPLLAFSTTAVTAVLQFFVADLLVRVRVTDRRRWGGRGGKREGD